MANHPAPPPSPADYAKRLFLCALYIVVSSMLIRYNKFLMHKDRFPYAMVLTSMHMAFSSVLCVGLYLLRPAFFPGMANTQGKRGLVLRWFVPIGLAFAVSLFTSNQAYLYCSVTFLQFMKEGNVIITFLMSCVVGLQSMNALRLVVILWVIAGSTIAIGGEIHFVLIGFCIQLASQFAECSRAVMGEVVLGGGGLRLDPLSYTMFVAPTCLFVLVIGAAATWDSSVLTALSAWWPYLLPNMLLAFTLNVLVATVIKEVSALGFILAGVCKDIALVLFSWAFTHEAVSTQQFVGFGIALAGVFFWSYMKAAPSSPAVQLAERVLGVQRPPPAADERTAFAVGAKGDKDGP